MLRIGGLQPTSLIDFPAKVSCVLFVSGCNFACPYCHNPDLLSPATPSVFSDLNAVKKFLMHHKPLLDGVVISGGEPTLQEDLINLCEHIKRWGFSIKLDTNGSRPSVIKALLQKNLVDYVAMDIKTGADLYPPQLMPLTDPGAIYRSIRLIMSSAPAYEFRTTCVKPFITRSTLTSIGRTIRGADLYILQQCQPDEVLYPGFFESSDVLYTDAELLDLKDLMDPWVCRCVVR